MQGTKVVIGTVYAVKWQGELARFNVTSVTTVRKGKHPTDFHHTVKGWLNVGGDTPNKEMSFDPDALLGEFSEFKELVAARQAEEAAKKAKEQADLDAATEVIEWLYKTAGIKPPEKKPGHDYRGYDYRDPFRLQYGRAIDINAEGVSALLKRIKVDA